ncbi:MAG: hypothetical protein QHH02_02240 [Syntrophomonadaceae bacterium]|nr:hypothetical protein [Syntrophomonadaceae bacterium]
MARGKGEERRTSVMVATKVVYCGGNGLPEAYRQLALKIISEKKR